MFKSFEFFWQLLEWLQDKGDVYLATHVDIGQDLDATRSLLQEHNEFKSSTKVMLSSVKFGDPVISFQEKNWDEEVDVAIKIWLHGCAILWILFMIIFIVQCLQFGTCAGSTPFSHLLEWFSTQIFGNLPNQLLTHTPPFHDGLGIWSIRL